MKTKTPPNVVLSQGLKPNYCVTLKEILSNSFFLSPLVLLNASFLLSDTYFHLSSIYEGAEAVNVTVLTTDLFNQLQHVTATDYNSHSLSLSDLFYPLHTALFSFSLSLPPSDTPRCLFS